MTAHLLMACFAGFESAHTAFCALCCPLSLTLSLLLHCAGLYQDQINWLIDRALAAGRVK